jgi:hypothetical protein
MGPVPPAHPQRAGSVLDLSQLDCAGTGPLDLEQILASVRETAYRWDFKSDRID